MSGSPSVAVRKAWEGWQQARDARREAWKAYWNAVNAEEAASERFFDLTRRRAHALEDRDDARWEAANLLLDPAWCKFCQASPCARPCKNECNENGHCSGLC